MGKGLSFQQIALEQDIYIVKKTFNPYFTVYMKANLSWIID